MKRAYWSISLLLVLMVVIPMAGAAPRERMTARASRIDVSQQIVPLRVVPLRVAPLRHMPLRIRPLRVGPPGVTPPPGAPPGITPPTDTPRDDTPPGQAPSLRDASRDYRGQLAVFPGAEGFGSRTRAGRGGRILRVTSLADAGPGTLREAVNTPGPRTVIFEVGGIIRLKRRLEVFEPYLTIAGQTAPSPGITLAGDALKFNTHDVLVQHLRVRVGDAVTDTNTALGQRDGIGVRTNPEGSTHTYNIFIDHCSVSWASDENVSVWYPNVYDITVTNSIISEALPFDRNKIYSFGMITGPGQRRISVLRNLFAHNGDRNPKFNVDNSGLAVNNVIYNVGHSAVSTKISDEQPSLLTVIGNVYLPGRDTRPRRKLVRANSGHPDSRLFVDDNIGPYSDGNQWSVVDNRAGAHIKADHPPVSVAPLEILDAARVLGHVLRNAGARPADRDAVDRRVVRDVRLGRGRLIESPAEVGGLPATRSTYRRLTPPNDPRFDADRDGYTDVEEWLHCMAQKAEGRSTWAAYNCPGPQQGVRPLGGGGN